MSAHNKTDVTRLSIIGVCLAALTLAACAKDPSGRVAEKPAAEAANEFADPTTLGYFNLPKVDDPNLRKLSELTQTNYVLTMIQSFTVSHPTKISAAFEQKLNTAGDPRAGDSIRFESFRNGNTEKKDYRLAAQLNLPLAVSMRTGSVAFETVKEYWNQVFTTGEREWALNTKPNATATNPSIEDTLKHPTTNKGIYSHAPTPAMKNTVYLTIEASKLYVYLKTQLKNETAYVRLEYTSTEPSPAIETPVVVSSAPAPLPAPAVDQKPAAKPAEQMEALGAQFILTSGFSLELETLLGGTGVRSFFGSGTSGPESDSVELLENELRQIRQQLAVIVNSHEIRSLMTELNIETVKIINPYNSKNQPEVLRGETGRATLLIELAMTEVQIIAVLKNAQAAVVK